MRKDEEGTEDILYISIWALWVLLSREIFPFYLAFITFFLTHIRFVQS